MSKCILVTGSCGLIGSEVAVFFARRGFRIVGVDSNHRAVFFGPEGDTGWMRDRLQRDLLGYRHEATDIRDRERVLTLMREVRPDIIIHTAAQPSHDKAAAIPFLDFEVNALGTLHLLEAARRFCPESPFVHMSTNKVYGDRPNTIPLKELETRWEYNDPAFVNGIPENFPIDQSKHSIFGASKVAGDVMVQEYGRYFNMPTCCLRGGCLTGPNHSGVELHGFLSYLIKCNVQGEEYRVYGYKGKQVRDNLHAEDVARFIFEFVRAPRVAEVYNLGGGKDNSCSILEAFRLAAETTGREMKWRYIDENRIGDHICYYSDLRKMKTHFPAWEVARPLRTIFQENAAMWESRLLVNRMTPRTAAQNEIRTRPHTTSLSKAEPICSVLVPSCDAYSDLWRPFFTMFWRHWPDCPFPVYLGCNEKTFSHTGVEIIHANHGTNWTNRVRQQLTAVPTPYVLLMLEDFFLRKPVSTQDVIRHLSTLVEVEGHMLRLVRRPAPVGSPSQHANTAVIEVGEPYRVSTQAAIWNKATLLALMRDHESIWDFETEGTRRSGNYTEGFYGTLTDVLPYGHHVVEKGKWFRKEAAWCGKADIGCDFAQRAIMSHREDLSWKCWKARSVVLNCIPWKPRLALRAVIARVDRFGLVLRSSKKA